MLPKKVISLGYERRSLDELIDILTKFNVEKLLDVREIPFSRRKCFRKKILAVHLENAGIEYIHIQKAGNPYHKETKDIEKCLNLYSSYLSNNPKVVDLVAGELLKTTIAMLCYERKHEKCHRSVLLNSIFNNGHNIDIIRIE